MRAGGSSPPVSDPSETTAVFCGDDCGRTAARAAGNPVGRDGIPHGAESAVLVRRSHGEFIAVGLADDDASRGFDTFDSGGIVGRDVMLEHLRAARERTPLVRMTSLMATGTPASRPGSSPLAIPASTRSAASSARSEENSRNAFVFGFSRSAPSQCFARDLDRAEFASPPDRRGWSGCCEPSSFDHLRDFEISVAAAQVRWRARRRCRSVRVRCPAAAWLFLRHRKAPATSVRRRLY